jgi:hypothetical protein
VNYDSRNFESYNRCYLLAVAVYVAYRSSQPDRETRKKVQEELQKNKVDVTTLVNWPADHCPQLESTERGSSTETPV